VPGATRDFREFQCFGAEFPGNGSGEVSAERRNLDSEKYADSECSEGNDRNQDGTDSDDKHQQNHAHLANLVGPVIFRVDGTRRPLDARRLLKLAFPGTLRGATGLYQRHPHEGQEYEPQTPL
jgi:hypothetical protein